MFLPWSILPNFLSGRHGKKSRPASAKRTKPQSRRQAIGRTLGLEPLEDRVVPATFFVDVTNPVAGTGTALNPFKHLQDAINAATANPLPDDIFVFGNSTGNPQHVYVWTRDGDRNGDGLQDGNLTLAANDRITFRAQTLLQGPSGASAPLIVKMANNIVDISGQMRVEGSAGFPVIFTSFQDDAAGGDTNGDGNISQPQRLDWGGIRFRGEAVDQGAGSATGSFISFADIRYTGATLFDPVISQPIEFASIRMEYDGTNAAVVRVWDTTFRTGGKALDVHFKSLAGTGPDIGGGGGVGPGQGAQHPLTFIDNSINGLFVNIPFTPIVPLYDVDSQWDDVGTPYVLTQRLKLSANLTIDPGMVIKVQNNAIVDASVSSLDNGASPTSRIMANGTVEKPILFTSLTDDDMGILAQYYNNGSADTNNDGLGSPQPGDWGGIRVVNGNIDYGIIRYGGGSVPAGDGTFQNQSPLEINTFDLRPFGPLQDFRVSNTDISLSLGAVPTVDIRGNGLITVIDNNIHDNQGLAIRGASSTYGTIYHPLGGYGIHYRRNRFSNNANNGVFTDTISGTGYLDDTDLTLTVGTSITVGGSSVRQIMSRREAIPYVDITNPVIGTATDYLRRFQGTGVGNTQYQSFIAQLQGQGINQGPFGAFPGDNGLFFRVVDFETTARGVGVPGVTTAAPGNLRGYEWRDIGVDITTTAAGGLFPLKTLNVGGGAPSGTNILTTSDTPGNNSTITLTFPNMVSAVGFYVVNNLSTSANEVIEFYGDQGQLLESIPLPTTAGGPVFVGRISKAPIHRIVIRENGSDGDFMGIDDLHYVDASESMLIKMADDAVITAGGFDAADVDPDTGEMILGPTLRIMGQPDSPVIITPVHDDSVGTGPVGSIITDVTNNGNGSVPTAGNWTGIQIRPGVNTSQVEYVAQQADGSIIRRSSDRNPYTIGDETDLNPNLSSLPDTLTRLVSGGTPAHQNLQDGTLIEHTHIRFASIGIDSQNYPDGKLVLEGNESESNNSSATADVLLPLAQTNHAATRYGGSSFVNGSGIVSGPFDFDFFELANADDPLGGSPAVNIPIGLRSSYNLGIGSIPLYVDVDHTPIVPPGQTGAGAPRVYNIFVFNAFDQLVYMVGPNGGGGNANFLGRIMEIPGDIPADFSGNPGGSDWDAEYVVIAPRGVLPRVLVPDTLGGRLPQGVTPTPLALPGGTGFAVAFFDANGDVQDTPGFSDFMTIPNLPPGNIFSSEGYEVEIRTPNVTQGGVDIHFGNANDAIRPTGDSITLTSGSTQTVFTPVGGMIYRSNLITNSAVSGILLQDHTITVADQLIPTQSGRYFFSPTFDRDNGGNGPAFANPNNYLPGANVYNNVIARGQGNGITITEHNPLSDQVRAATGYHQIHNNTIHDNQAVGIDIITKGGPNVLDNIITKNNIGVRVNDLGFAGATTVVNYNLFHQNTANIQGTTNGSNNLLNQDPLYVDQVNLDLRVFARPGSGSSSPAVDAGLSNLSDRLFGMRDADVPTRVPNDDFRNRKRNDNPARSNTGSGNFPFFDIGAYETNEAALRVISVTPFFTTTGSVPGPVSSFTIQFAGRADPATVNTNTVKVRRSGVNQPIGTITNSYDPVRDIHTFTFTFNTPISDGSYTIFLDGTAPNSSDPAIRDIAGQLLDGEFPPPATSPVFSFPSGNNVPGGDFNYAFNIVTSSIGDLVWNDLNGDGVRQTNEPGISNVTIDLRAAGPDGIAGTGDDILLPSQVTDASGQYLFSNLTPGQYLVDVRDSTLPSNFVITNPPDPRIINLGIADARTDVDFGYRLDLQNATIGDLVWNDTNGDGVRQIGEPGIGGVKIDLLGSGPDLVLGTSDDVIFPSQFTGAGGAYQFSSLPGWTFRVSVDLTSPALAGFGLTTGNTPLVVSLTPGQQFLAADFGFIEQNSGLGDQVWEDLDGNGALNGSEVGLPGVQVFIDLNNNNSFDTGEPTANTDANGNYFIPSLAPGTYKVMVNFSTLPPGNYVATTPYPRTVTLGSNDNRTDVDFGFRIDPQTSQLGGLVFNDLFGDGAFTGGDSGLSGINVQLTWAGRDGLFGTGDDQSFGPFATNGAGNWLSPATMPSGIYRVQVVNPPSPGFTQTTPGGNPQTVTVAIGEAKTNINFGYQQRQASIGNRVWNDANGDGVQAGVGEPGINGVRVNLRYAGPDGILDTADDVLQGPVITSGDGNYSFTNLGAGTYRITVDPNSAALTGFAPTTPNPQVVLLPGGSAGDSTDLVDFGFQTANAAIGDRVFNDLNGDGIQQAGEVGIAGVRVFIDLNTNGVFDPGTDLERTTNSSGAYQFTGLTAGNYRVIVDQSTLPGGTTPTIPNPPDVVVTLASDQVRSDIDFGFLLPPGTPGGIFYLTLKGGNTLTNSDGSKLTVTDVDIVKLVVSTDGTYTYSLYFAGKDFGLSPGSETIDAFSFMPDGDILISIKGSFSVKPVYTAPKSGSGTNITGFGEDVLRFRPTSADANGRITSGSYRNTAGTGTGLFFKGSTRGLSGSAENVDAVAVLADGRLLLSTKGVATVAGLANRQPNDILAYNPANNTWSLYFEGSDAGLTGSAENVDAIALSDPSSALPTLYLSTSGNFSVPGLSGDKKDIFAFNPTSLGANTAGSYGPGITLRGSDTGMSSNMDITGMWLGLAPGTFPLHASGSTTQPEMHVGNRRWVEADGQINVWIDTSNGLLDAGEVSRIRDALTAMDTASRQSGGPEVVEVADPSKADVRISSQAGSLIGGQANGVLGATQVAFSLTPSGKLASGESFYQLLGHEYGMLSQVVLIDGWNWYTGADPAGIAADQYDLQSVATHELGHILGLNDNRVDSTAAMFEILGAGQIRRSYEGADLAFLDQLYAPVSEAAPLPTPATSVAGPGSPSAGEPGALTLLNGGSTSAKTTVQNESRPSTSNRKSNKARTQDDRQAADQLFSAGAATKARFAASRTAELQEEWWQGLPA